MHARCLDRSNLICIPQSPPSCLTAPNKVRHPAPSLRRAAPAPPLRSCPPPRPALLRLVRPPPPTTHTPQPRPPRPAAARFEPATGWLRTAAQRLLAQSPCCALRPSVSAPQAHLTRAPSVAALRKVRDRPPARACPALLHSWNEVVVPRVARRAGGLKAEALRMTDAPPSEVVPRAPLL